jgi:hypothetical protein
MLSLIVFMAMGAGPVTAKPCPPGEPAIMNADVPIIYVKRKEEPKYNIIPIQTKTGGKIRITCQSFIIETKAVRIDDGANVTLFVATDDGKMNITSVQKAP